MSGPFRKKKPPSGRRPGKKSDPGEPRIPVAEQLLIAHLERLTGDSAWMTTLGRAQTTIRWAAANPQGQALCLSLDRYLADETEVACQIENLPNLSVVCAADFPPAGEQAPAVVAIPVSSRGDAELTRDLLQSGYERLREGGILATAVDQSEDVWLREQMQLLAKSVTRIANRAGVIYLLHKTGPLKRPRDFSCEFAFRDTGVEDATEKVTTEQQEPIRLFSRPGVFSHRRLDLGARALIERMVIQPGSRVIDLGCGCGAVGIAAGLRAGAGGTVHFVDSSPRAIECATKGATASDLSFTTQLEAAGKIEPAGTFDVALTNPPYYSHFRISEILLSAAHRALKPGGRVFAVAKPNDWLPERMAQLFTKTKTETARGYIVVSGFKE